MAQGRPFRRSRIRRAAVLLAGLGLAGRGAATCRLDPVAGTWTETFETTGCLASARHLAPAASGGMTISPALQTWTLPETDRFSGGAGDAGVEVTAKGSLSETVSLWQRIDAPGTGLAYPSACVPTTMAPCPITPGVKGAPNGLLHRDNPGTVPIEGLTGFPGFAGGVTTGAGWDTQPLGAPMCTTAAPPGPLGGVTGFFGQAIGTATSRQDLAPGIPYAASFAISADHQGKAVPYVEFQFFNRRTNLPDPGAWVANETDLLLPWSTNFSGMTPCTIQLAPALPDDAWEPRVLARAANPYCTVLGPVYLTAQQGVWDSPILDSLSADTAWQQIQWDVDQNRGVTDPACACAPGSPVTPIELFWEIAAAPPAVPAQPAGTPLLDHDVLAIPAAGAGRYLRLRAILHGRETAAAVPAVPPLAPTNPHTHFSGWRPAIQSLRVTYFARAGLAESHPLAPVSLKSWGTVTYAAETPGGSKVSVDVLDAAGALLYANVPSGFPLDPAVNPYQYPALRLRARLEADPAAPGTRPVISKWRITWTPLPERLSLNRNSLRPSAGETVAGLVSVELGGRVRVRVHDAAGQTVRTVLDDLVEPKATPFSWDGRNTRGEIVVPGVYYVTASTPKGSGTRKVVVTR